MRHSFAPARELISFRLSLKGTNAQIAQKRGCDSQGAAVSSPPFLLTKS